MLLARLLLVRIYILFVRVCVVFAFQEDIPVLIQIFQYDASAAAMAVNGSSATVTGIFIVSRGGRPSLDQGSAADQVDPRFMMSERYSGGVVANIATMAQST